MKRRWLLLAAALLPAALRAQNPSTEQRWKKELDAFAAAVPWKPADPSYGGTKAPTLRTRNSSPGPVPVSR